MEIHTIQSDSNDIHVSLFSFDLFINVMQKCRTIELLDYRYAPVSDQ